jgi:hypothetical protein
MIPFYYLAAMLLISITVIVIPRVYCNIFVNYATVQINFFAIVD